MESLHIRFGRLLFLVLAVTLIEGCRWWYKPQPPEPPLNLPPSISPPPIPQRPVHVDVDRLPERARAIFPAYEGEGLIVTLPAAAADELSPRQVLDDVVAPVLSSIGMQNPEDRMRMPSSGRKMPQAYLSGLAEITCQEVDGMKSAGAHKICAALRSETADEEVDRLMLGGEGMTFEQYKADIERVEIEYLFAQVENEIPIEHMGIIAARWVGSDTGQPG